MRSIKTAIMFLVAVLLSSPLLHATQVTFQVDLSSQSTISPDGIHILGTFNAHDPDSTPLTNISPGHYAITLNLPAGSREMYKFVNGDTWTGTEGVYGNCAFNTYRLLQVPVNDTVLPPVCFGHCDSTCTQPTGTRIACVGNSITFGFGLADPATESYPSRLQAGLGQPYRVENFGASGTAVIRAAGNPYTATDQFRHLLTFQPAQVLLMLGINDSKAQIWGPYSGRFAADYDSLWLAMDTLASHPQVWICLPTKAFSGLFGINDLLLTDSIIPRIRAHARRRCLNQIDMQGFTSTLGSGFPDGIHPDAATAQTMANEIQRLLQFPPPHILQNGAQLTANGGYAWQWYHNGDTVPTAAGGQAPTLTATQSGTYQVAVKVDSLFEHILISDTAVVSLVHLTPIEPATLLLFPNPAQDRLYWKLDKGYSDGPWEVSIFDLQGQKRIHATEKQSHDAIDLDCLPTGLYMIEFTQADISISGILWKE